MQPAKLQPKAARAITLDSEDNALLVAIARAEKLTLSDTVRRAIRAYAKQLGVTVTPEVTQ